MSDLFLTTILAVAVQVDGGKPPTIASTPVPLVFASDVRMIRLDVSVVDGHGKPVRGLAAGDFSIMEDGKGVQLSVFEAMEDGARATSSPGEDGGQMTLAVNGSVAALSRQGQRLVIVADPDGLSPMQLARVRTSTCDFIARLTLEGDRVRLINLSTREVTEGVIPGDRARLAAAARTLDRNRGHHAAHERGDSIADQLDFKEEEDVAEAYSQSFRTERFLSQFSRTGELLSLFDEILIQLAAIPGRKSLILISDGFPEMRTLSERLERTAHLAREAQAAIHFVDAYGLDGLLPEGPGRHLSSPFELAWNRSGGSQELAEATGGFVSRFANVLTSALSRAAEEARSYYIVGYIPVRRDDGRFRTVKVRVNRPNVTVRTKKGYISGGVGSGLVSRRVR